MIVSVSKHLEPIRGIFRNQPEEIEMFVVGMRASGGDMCPSYAKILCIAETLDDAMTAVKADIGNKDSFFVPFMKRPRPSRDPMILGSSQLPFPFHDYYICEGELGGQDPYGEIMSKRRVSFSRGNILHNGLPPISEWKWRNPLF